MCTRGGWVILTLINDTCFFIVRNGAMVTVTPSPSRLRDAGRRARDSRTRGGAGGDKREGDGRRRGQGTSGCGMATGGRSGKIGVQEEREAGACVDAGI